MAFQYEETSLPSMEVSQADEDLCLITIGYLDEDTNQKFSWIKNKEYWREMKPASCPTK